MSSQTSPPVRPTHVQAEPDGARTEYYDIELCPPSWNVPGNKLIRLPAILEHPRETRGTLLNLLLDLFVDHWRSICFGSCIEGAVFELKFANKPEHISLLDGYLTVELPPGPAHVHLCIGEHRGLGNSPTPRELAKIRPCARAALYRTLGSSSCTPHSWGLRLWNGAGEQMLTVFLPSPRLGDDMQRIKADGSRLELWNSLRREYLGETAPQPLPWEDPPATPDAPPSQ